MSWLSTITAAAKAELAQPAGSSSVPTQPAAREDLQDVLLDMAKWGRPRVSMPSGKGWYSSIEVNITPTGDKFDVASEFGMATPLEAALQCRERLHAAVKAVGGKA